MRLMKWTTVLLAAAVTLSAARFGIENIGRIVRLSDPQIAPNGKSITVVVSHANYDEDRYDAELVMIDVATHAQRVLTHDRRGLGQARWSPDGSRLAFLAAVEGKSQIFIMPMTGGDSWQLTKSPTGVQQYAWRPGHNEIAFVATDEAPKVTGEERHNRSFEIQNNDYLITEAPRPAHVWLISTESKATRKLTSGAWTLPVSLPPSAPSSPLSWSPDGKRLAIVKVASPYTGDSDRSAIQLLDVDSGNVHALTSRTHNETQPLFSPDGGHIAHWYPRDGVSRNVNEIYVGPASGGDTASVTRAIDRNVQRAIWMPDGKSLLVSANDGTTTGLWIQPIDGKPRRVELGKVVANASFWLDASMGPAGELAFTGTEPTRPAELYYLRTTASAPERITDFNHETAAIELGRSETVQWENDGFHADGVVTYPPDFAASRKYPLVLYVHGGPRSASKECVFQPRAIAGRAGLGGVRAELSRQRQPGQRLSGGDLQ